MSKQIKFLIALVLAFSIAGTAKAILDSQMYLPLVMRAPSPTATLTPTRTPSGTITVTLTRTPTGTPTTGVRITDIDYKPPNNEMNETVTIRNFGNAAVDMTGWTLRDDSNNIFTFPSFTLGGGKIVKVWTKVGVNSATDLYWGLTEPVWNNGGDCAYLRDKDKNKIFQVCY